MPAPAVRPEAAEAREQAEAWSRVQRKLTHALHALAEAHGATPHRDHLTRSFRQEIAEVSRRAKSLRETAQGYAAQRREDAASWEGK